MTKRNLPLGGSAKMAAENAALCVHMYWRMYMELYVPALTICIGIRVN
jgi:hypothetical protein